jgi:hypothetical protein
MALRMIPWRTAFFAICLAMVPGVQSSPARADDPSCPGPRQGEKFPFDSTDIIFDSFTLPDPTGHAKLVNCVRVLKPSYPYHVDWVGSGIDAFTGTDGSQSSSLYVGDDTQMDPSTAFVGINRTRFDPHLIHDKPWWVKVGDRILSTFDGAVSTIPHDRPEKERLERLQPAALRFVAQLTEPGRARLEFSNAAPDAGAIRFTAPDELRQLVPQLEPEFSIGAEASAVEYSIGDGEAAAQRIIITLRNSDGQAIGSIPIVAVLATERR